MEELSTVNRPVTMGELAIVFGVKRQRLERLARRKGIRPACLIGPTRAYGPVQARRLFDAVQEADAAAKLAGAEVA